ETYVASERRLFKAVRLARPHDGCDAMGRTRSTASQRSPAVTDGAATRLLLGGRLFGSRLLFRLVGSGLGLGLLLGGRLGFFLVLGSGLLRRRLLGLGRLVSLVSLLSRFAFAALGGSFLGGLLRRRLLLRRLRRRRAFLGFDGCLEFLAGHFPFGDLGLVEQEVDDLVLVERLAQLRLGHRVLADVLDEPLAVFGAVLLGGLLDQHAHFLRSDFDAVLLADLGQQQPQAHAALGNAA